jgi:hypothetical protein
MVVCRISSKFTTARSNKKNVDQNIAECIFTNLICAPLAVRAGRSLDNFCMRVTMINQIIAIIYWMTNYNFKYGGKYVSN